MNLEVKTKWIEALRSGKYSQGAGALREQDNFCCLGVLCDIMKPGGWSVFDTHDSYHGMPSPEIISQSGLRGLLHNQRYPTVQLSMMNDNGKSFLEIADWIEENL